MPRLWVVNASPLIILGRVVQLHLAERLAETIIVPRAVAREIEAGADRDPARQWLTGPGRDHVREEGDPEPIVAHWDLGRGESHVLSWAFRHPGFEAILDDLAARKCAEVLSIPVRGTLGIILLAKKEGQVAPVLERIREAGFHITPDLFDALRRLAGE